MRVWRAGQAFATGLFLFWLLFYGGVWGARNVSIRVVEFGSVKAYVVIADLNSKQVSVNVSVANQPLNNRAFPHEPFKSIVERDFPTAAIDGTYYDTRNYKPVGILVSRGELIQPGTKGVAVCFDAQNHVKFYRLKDWRNFPWRNYKVVISTGPTLVENGKISLFPYSEGFRDPELFGRASRSALGVTRSGKLLLVAVRFPISLRQMASIMKALGAETAVNLDGGTSTALYYRGRYLAHPARLITNAIMVYEHAGPSEKKEAVGLK